MSDQPRKIRALVGCQNDWCAAENSYPLDMVRQFDGAPICEGCYVDRDRAEREDDDGLVVRWADLPPLTLADLSE